MIGMLIKTLALRAFPSAEKRFVDFLLEVKTNVLNALENQDYPFKELIDKIETKRDLSRNPIFDNMLLVQNLDAIAKDINKAGNDNGEFLIDDLIRGFQDRKTDEVIEQAESPDSPVDIQIAVSEIEEKIFINLVYCVKLFNKDTMERFLKHFIEIISIVTANKEINIKDIIISHDLGKAQSNIILGEKTDFIF